MDFGLIRPFANGKGILTNSRSGLRLAAWCEMFAYLTNVGVKQLDV